MVFSSLTFVLVFLPFCLITYLIVNAITSERYRCRLLNITLVVFSMFFYAWGEPGYIVLLRISMIGNFFLANTIDLNRGSANARVWLIIGVILNLGFLAYFKYLNFFLRRFSVLSSRICRRSCARRRTFMWRCLWGSRFIPFRR